MTTEAAHNSFLTKKSNEVKLNNVISMFGKTEPGNLRFSQLLYLLLDRCIFTNRFTLNKFVQLFNAATKVVSKQPKKEPVVVPGQPQPTQPAQRQLSREQFIYFLNQLGKFLYKEDKNYMQRIFFEVLTQKVQADSNNDMSQPRVFSPDDTNKKLLFEPAITTLVSYQRDIRGLFNIYMDENYHSIKNEKRLLLTERELDLQNKKLYTQSFLNFIKEAEITPHIISIDHIEDILKAIVPYTDGRENEYYHRHCLVDFYTNNAPTEDKWKNASDPGIMFFEFQLILARIAWETFPKDQDKKGIDNVMATFFKKVLSLRTRETMTSVEIVPYKKHLIRLKEYYDRYASTEEIMPQKLQPPMVEKDMVKVMAEKHEAEIANMPVATVDLAQMLRTLEKELPKMPPIPTVHPENPPPFKDQKIVMGQQPPPEEKGDEKGKGGDAKKDAGKKDEQPIRVFPWAKPPTYIKSSEDYFQQLATRLSFETKPLSALERGELKRDPIPTLISQNVFPPEMPKQVEATMMAARTCTLQKNFFLAIDNYNKAYNIWKQFHKKRSEDMPENIELFFNYIRGNLYSSAGKDDHALTTFYNCRKHIEGGKLGFVNPDRALPYFGIGQVLYDIAEFELAARAFLKAREMREPVLGIQHVQTATVFNNLGACFFMLGRSVQALGYTQIAEAVFSAELGPHHERTMTAKGNLNKINRGQFKHQPEYRKLWQVYEKDLYEGGKKKKKAAGKKK